MTQTRPTRRLPGPLGARLRDRPPAGARGGRALDLALAALVAAAVVVVMLPSFGERGATFDEGRLLAYPMEVLDGRWPDRDFQTLYGPGHLWLLAGLFKLLGPSVAVERAVGLSFHVLIALGVFLLGRPWGRLVAVAGGLLSGALLIEIDLGAYAWQGALGMTLVGLGAGVHAALRHRAGRAAGALMIAAGLVSGLATLWRFEIGLPVALGALVLLTTVPGRLRLRWLGGFALGASPYLVHLAVLGPGRAWDVVESLRANGPGRKLPLPPLSKPEGELLLATAVAVAAIALVGLVRVLRDRRDPAGRLGLAIGAFLVGTFPYVLVRTESVHILSVACAAVALAPVAVMLALGGGPEGRRRAGHTALPAQALAAVAGVLLVFVPGSEIVRTAAERQLSDLRGTTEHTVSYEIVRGERSFPVGEPETARDVQALLGDVDRIARPGDRLFVGHRNMRLSLYNDIYLYYLLPELEPASFFMELNPLNANAPGTRLAADLETADLLILTDRYDSPQEPNASRTLGDPRPGEVVERRFCPVAARGAYTLLRRCR